MTTPDDLKTSLEGVQKSAADADGAGCKIVEAAEERMAIVDKALDELRPKALTDIAAANEYLDLIEESGRLALVIGGG
jgi:hypothetical protein